MIKRASSFYTVPVLTTLIFLPKLISTHTTNFEHPFFDEVITADYKVQVEAGKLDCYHQYVVKGALLYVDFNVMSGGDGKTGFRVTDPFGQIVMTEDWNAGGSYETSSAIEGYYAACIDNTISIFFSKLVNVYFHTYKEEYVDILNPEQLEIELGLDNLTTILSGVGSRINKISTYLHQSRAEESRDSALLEENNFRVFFWSSVQCTVIILTGGFHVYFIRKLFESPQTNSMKYRAKL